MPNTDYKALEAQYGANNYHPLDLVITHGQGVWVTDVDGNRYMDGLSAYSALNQGHAHPKILQTMVEQAAQVTLTSRAFRNAQLPLFYEALCTLTKFPMALPMNTGAEAVETAIKAARKWGYQHKGIAPNQAEIIVCANNFHGRTTTLISFSTEAQYRDGFGPFTPGFVIIPYGDAEALQQAITPNTCAFLLEPIQGEGGVIIPPSGYLSQVQALCKANQVLLLIDEIQTGLGRTGQLFAYQHELTTPEQQPDAVILGKALAGGFYPVSAVIGSKALLGVFQPGDHGSTFGGNPLGCAIARSALQVLVDEQLPQRAQQLGEAFLQKLQQTLADTPLVREVRGRGLMIGIELTQPARPYCEQLKTNGLLCKETHHTVIRFTPPLVISPDELDWAFERLIAVLGA